MTAYVRLEKSKDIFILTYYPDVQKGNSVEIWLIFIRESIGTNTMLSGNE